MKITMFYHSLLSDWNHGNAHFLRGIATELINRGHEVRIYEPKNNWSLQNLIKFYGEEAIQQFYDVYPRLSTNFFDPLHPSLDSILAGQDLVIVHEWNDHKLVKAIGAHKAVSGNYVLLFHDTHHRSVTDEKGIKGYDLTYYDGVLAYGTIIKNKYLEERWAQKAWAWHEAADTQVFFPANNNEKKGDLVWIGNWGDEERTKELFEFLINPVKELGIKAKVYGVRYPQKALKALDDAGIEYGGWLPNYKVPEIFSQYKLTVHIPRRPYVEALPGIPTIRPFEALACGVPLISSPWDDVEGLFRPGRDYLIAKNSGEMKQNIISVLTDTQLADSLSRNGLETIRKKHTCTHRVDELWEIVEQVKERLKIRKWVMGDG